MKAAILFSFYLACVVRGDQSIGKSDESLSKALEETGKSLAKSLTPFVAPVYRSLVEAVNEKRDRVYFELSRSTSFTGKETYLPFTRSYGSYPEAISATEGYFTVPVNGTYFLAFHALCDENGSDSCYLQMKRNAQRIASTYATRGTWKDMTMSSVVHLNAGDRIGIWIITGTLFDDASKQDDQYTKFSGFLI